MSSSRTKQQCVVMMMMMASLYQHSYAGEVRCETIPSTIRIAKEELSSNGDVERTCEQEVAVNKCEGTCRSQVQPSVMSPSGFNKECHCCKETSLRERKITLNSCYKSDGQKLTNEKSAMTIKLHEPASCRCSRCED